MRPRREYDKAMLEKLEKDVLEAILAEYGPIKDEEREDVLREFGRLARVAAIVIAVYGSEEWFVKYGGALVAFPDVDPIWTVGLDGATSPIPGPSYIALSRDLYTESEEYVPFTVPGLEDASPADLDAASWEEYSSRYPEAARHLETALRLAWAATHRFNVPVLVAKWRQRPPLSYRVVLPLCYLDIEDVLIAIDAMEWMLSQLREVGFPLISLKNSRF